MTDQPKDGATQPVYVILGGGGGIGSTLARRLAAAGGAVAVAGRNREKLDPLAEEIGGRAVEVDARDFDGVQQCLAEAREWGGRLDGVANCVGSILLKPAHLTTADELHEVIATNLTTAFATVRAAAPLMRQDGGSVVLLSSAAARLGLASHEAIAAAKAGVEGLARAAAATYAAQGVRVNVVAPGLVETPMSARIISNDAARKASVALHPLGRLGAPEDIAAALAWLLSEDSAWVTGQVIGVDGGLSSLKTRPKG